MYYTVHDNVFGVGLVGKTHISKGFGIGNPKIFFLKCI